MRLPRLDGGTPNINKECEWLPKLTPMLTTPISVPVYKGQPDDHYPYFWTVARWYDGVVPDFESNDEYEQLAKDLAHFINEFHAIQVLGGPKSRRLDFSHF
jgi:aminoglycoside phosphotransferase (APT) family kinase protein